MRSSNTNTSTKTPVDRRMLIQTIAGAGVGLIVSTQLGAQQAKNQAQNPEALAAERVHTFVRVAHSSLDETQSMLDAEPRLIRSAWDWGGGDFETALGAAGHMGRTDIAGLLLARGAPLELCACAMLGQLPVVRAALEIQPSLLHVPGPHGISLLAHAKRGGRRAAPVTEFLTKFEARHPATE